MIQIKALNVGALASASIELGPFSAGWLVEAIRLRWVEGSSGSTVFGQGFRIDSLSVGERGRGEELVDTVNGTNLPNNLSVQVFRRSNGSWFCRCDFRNESATELCVMMEVDVRPPWSMKELSSRSKGRSVGELDGRGVGG